LFHGITVLSRVQHSCLTLSCYPAARYETMPASMIGQELAKGVPNAWWR
jgi:hypothetical protein